MKKLLKPMLGLAVAAGFLFANINFAEAKTANVTASNIKVKVENELAESSDWYALFGSGWVLVVPGSN
jgi:hypothetical protein